MIPSHINYTHKIHVDLNLLKQSLHIYTISLQKHIQIRTESFYMYIYTVYNPKPSLKESHQNEQNERNKDFV